MPEVKTKSKRAVDVQREWAGLGDYFLNHEPTPLGVAESKNSWTADSQAKAGVVLDGLVYKGAFAHLTVTP